jgi:hypothetical protein
MRELTGHQVNVANDVLKIEVLDEPGSGGANHLYDISGFNSQNNPSFPHLGWPAEHSTILFQNGPIVEAGVNGVTHEALLAIVIDRLQAFQRGPFANDHNRAALDHLELAQKALLDRTRSRMGRGVEGTHQI